jgi:hypothetical protein
MKRVIAIALSVLLIGATYVPSASAAAKVTLSKSSDIAFEGEKVAMTIADFPAKSGLYVFQCVQPANGGALPDLRQCNSPDQLWITSSGRGSFLPTATDISIRLVGKFSTFDCTVDKCGLFFQFDRLAADDRSEDQFIPLTFKAASGTPTPTTTAAPAAPAEQKIGAIRTSIRVGQSLALPATTDKGVTVAYRLTSPKICSLKGVQVKAKRAGTCTVDAYAAPGQNIAMFAAALEIKVAKKKKK